MIKVKPNARFDDFIADVYFRADFGKMAIIQLVQMTHFRFRLNDYIFKIKFDIKLKWNF